MVSQKQMTDNLGLVLVVEVERGCLTGPSPYPVGSEAVSS